MSQKLWETKSDDLQENHLTIEVRFVLPLKKVNSTSLLKVLYHLLYFRVKSENVHLGEMLAHDLPYIPKNGVHEDDSVGELLV